MVRREVLEGPTGLWGAVSRTSLANHELPSWNLSRKLRRWRRREESSYGSCGGEQSTYIAAPERRSDEAPCIRRLGLPGDGHARGDRLREWPRACATQLFVWVPVLLDPGAVPVLLDVEHQLEHDDHHVIFDIDDDEKHDDNDHADDDHP